MGLILSMVVLSAIGDISRFPHHPKNLVSYAVISPGVHDSGETHKSKPITKEGRKELRWAMVEAAWAAIRSDPYWKAQFKRLDKRMHKNKAAVAIARRMLVSIWHILTKREPYHHFDVETIAYKMLIWSWAMDEAALKGMTGSSLSSMDCYGWVSVKIWSASNETVNRAGLPRRKKSWR